MESLRKFTQFHTHQEFDTLVSNLVKQDELQLRIRELLKYRKNGITRKEECTHFEQQHTRRQLWNKPIVRFPSSFFALTLLCSVITLGSLSQWGCLVSLFCLLRVT